MHVLVTGGAGFIGSHVVDRMLRDGHRVTAYDNLSTGKEVFLNQATKSPMFTLVRGDILDSRRLGEAMVGVDMVFHLAANADVRFGTQHPDKDLEQNTIGTFRVLEAMRLAGVKKIAFSSTGSIYGEATVIPTPETAPFPVQTSLYGASKLGGEGLITAYCEGFGFQAWIFRFVSILGERYTHGHVFDFYKQLRNHSGSLKVLGNGRQKKSYLYVFDCVEAICLALEKAQNRVNIFNLGTDEFIEVNDSIRWMSEYLKVTPKLEYSGGERGWIGDNPFIYLDTRKIRDLGWSPKKSIQEGVIHTIRYLTENPFLLSAGDPKCSRSQDMDFKMLN